MHYFLGGRSFKMTNICIVFIPLNMGNLMIPDTSAAKLKGKNRILLKGFRGELLTFETYTGYTHSDKEV